MTGMLSGEHEEWLEARGFDLEVVTRYGIYTDPQSHGGRDLVIPYRRDGKVINRKYRGPGKEFRQDKGAPRSFWNEDCLRDKSLEVEPLVITEGELDALAAIQAGFLRTVSVPDGAGSNLDFALQLWPLLQEASNVILAGDGDEAGRGLNAELARRLGAARCSWLDYPPGTKDLNDVLRVKGEEGVIAVVRGAKPYPLKGLYRLSDYPDIPAPVTFTTGFIGLNPHLRLWRGEFMVITGIPSHGKSRLDPWNRVEHKRRPGESEPDYQGRAIRSLTRFGRSYDCGVMVVAHPTKEVKSPAGEIRVPTLYDISGSAHWYNAPDHGVVIAGDTLTNLREVKVEKSRYHAAGDLPGSAYLRLENGRLQSVVPPASA